MSEEEKKTCPLARAGVLANSSLVDLAYWNKIQDRTNDPDYHETFEPIEVLFKDFTPCIEDKCGFWNQYKVACGQINLKG